jgi:hypothetical protein
LLRLCLRVCGAYPRLPQPQYPSANCEHVRACCCVLLRAATCCYGARNILTAGARTYNRAVHMSTWAQSLSEAFTGRSRWVSVAIASHARVCRDASVFALLAHPTVHMSLFLALCEVPARACCACSSTRTVAVTGSGGLIGSALARKLQGNAFTATTSSRTGSLGKLTPAC